MIAVYPKEAKTMAEMSAGNIVVEDFAIFGDL
jgi:hypothetical protein